MKKIGITAGLSFLAGAIFCALTFGYFQETGNNGTFLSTDVAQAETLKVPGPNFTSIVKKVRPAVVQVLSEAIVERRSPFGDEFLDRFFGSPRGRRERVSGSGSGFFISKDGYLITNNHVVKNAIKIRIVDVDNKEYTATKIGADPKSDLALLKVEGDNFSLIELGDSNKLEVGEWVLAIGNPFGQGGTVTAGIVSAKGRELQGLEVEYQNFIQTDAAINRGNSGGPLINMEGKAIGINSVILSNSGGNIGIGFSIPSNMARKVMKDLKEEGRVVRGYLGVTINDIPESEAKDYDLESGGILVETVDPDSPAEKAGLKRYDIIVEIDDREMESTNKLKAMVANMSPGDKIELTVLRGAEKKKLTLVVGEAPDTVKVRGSGDLGRSYDLGMVLMDNSQSVARRYELDTSEGVVVREVKRDSNAARNGIRGGDIILRVNRYDIESVAHFREIISTRRPGSRVLMIISRGGSEYLTKYKLPE
ncbi:MAG: Do family serine endopeptidase [Candidatus Aminicenantes bacterium]|nr:Do family serine endopeptidase [Candidatus Aminicenantes bacterium]